MKKSTCFVHVALLATVPACAPPTVVTNTRPQLETAGGIEGVVTDERGTPISGVAVLAGSKDGRSLAITDEGGRYEIHHLRPGAYDVTFDPCQVGGRTIPVRVSRGASVAADARLGTEVVPRVARIPTPDIAGGASVGSRSTGVHGVVADKFSGQPLFGVTVVVASASTARSAVTDDSGRYDIGGLAAGRYKVTFFRGGVTLGHSDVRVTAKQMFALDATVDGSKAPVDVPGLVRSPIILGGTATDDGHRLGRSPGAAPPTSASRRKLLASANDADEIWIIARGSQRRNRKAARRKYGSGQMCGYIPSEGKNVLLPLARTDVKADILAYTASVDVKQSYENPYREKIEAIYVFPLPQNAAVNEFVMTIGKRRIRGIIRERDEAEKIYQEARASGYMAALLTQERPNIFTQKISNIGPGKKIDIKLTYYHTLPYRDGAYTFVFPTVVGPRFNPKDHRAGVGAVARGTEGSSGRPTEVGYAKRGTQTARNLSIRVDVDAGVEIEGIKSENHAVRSRKLSRTRHRVTLAKGAAIPNRDYVLRYRVAGKGIKSGFLVDTGRKGDKYFTFLLQPPAELSRTGRAPMEMVFVLDGSNSMAGVPIAKAKRAIRRVLSRLGPEDTFQIIRFSDHTSASADKPIPATQTNVERGLRYLDSVKASGAKRMVEGIKAALKSPHASHRLRVVTFMTDGFIGNEKAALSAIHANLGESRIFSFGVGSSVNRFLLERMAQIGRGAVAYVGLNDEAADHAVDAFYKRISHPELTDITLDFGDMNVSEVYPSRIPDLLVGRPIVVTGKLRGGLGRYLQVKGRIRSKAVAYRIDVDAGATRNHPGLATAWARAKMADLTNRASYEHDRRRLRRAIRKLSLHYGLMSSYTSFLAVDTALRTGGIERQRKIPVTMPTGIHYDRAILP